MVQRSRATKKANTWKRGKEEKDEKDDHPKDEEHLDVKQASILPRESKNQALYDESFLSEWIRTEKNPVDYRDENLQ